MTGPNARLERLENALADERRKMRAARAAARKLPAEKRRVSAVLEAALKERDADRKQHDERIGKLRAELRLISRRTATAVRRGYLPPDKAVGER